MKLILANNQGRKFREFYDDLARRSDVPFHYKGYESVLFYFESGDSFARIDGENLTDYDGVFINGYASTPEMALTLATVCHQSDVPFQNTELSNYYCPSKLRATAVLSAGTVRIPAAYGGTRTAIVQGNTALIEYPAVLKRATADRCVDNWYVQSREEVEDLLDDKAPRTLWLLQQYIDNVGCYTVNLLHGEIAYGIYRTKRRARRNPRKTHFYRPQGGANATWLMPADIPENVRDAAALAAEALLRQTCSVDVIVERGTGLVYVTEVNYNPQFVTVETFSEERKQVWLNALSRL